VGYGQVLIAKQQQSHNLLFNVEPYTTAGTIITAHPLQTFRDWTVLKTETARFPKTNQYQNGCILYPDKLNFGYNFHI